MRFTLADLGHVKFSIAGALLMIGVGAATVLTTTHWLTIEQRLARDTEAKRRDIQGRLLRAREEEAEIKSKIARFDALLQRGVIGEERRLDWVEEIRRIRDDRRLLEMRYELAPQQPLDTAIAPGTSGSFDFLASVMRLEIDLLHEGDLVNLIGDLRGSVSAFVRPRSCVLERKAGGAQAASRLLPIQLGARCTVDWITIREKKPSA